jgi:hypothetical protein
MKLVRSGNPGVKTGRLLRGEPARFNDPFSKLKYNPLRMLQDLGIRRKDGI